MTAPTLEERARDARRKWGTEEYDPRVGLFEESVQLLVAFAESERRSAQVEALERAAGEAPKKWVGEWLLLQAERVKNGGSLT